MAPAAREIALKVLHNYLAGDLELTAADAGEILTVALARSLALAVSERPMTEPDVDRLLGTVRLVALDGSAGATADNALHRLARGLALLADDFGQPQQMLAQILLADGAIVAHQLDLLGGEGSGFRGGLRLGVVLEEEGHGDAEELGGGGQPSGREPVFAILVFLHRLEAHADSYADLFLTGTHEKPRLTQTAADRHVDLVGAPLSRLLPARCLRHPIHLGPARSGYLPPAHRRRCHPR